MSAFPRSLNKRAMGREKRNKAERPTPSEGPKCSLTKKTKTKKSGELVLNALFAKELPVEPCRALSGVQDDSERDDASDDAQIPQPVRISREFWGPRATGRRGYCQRLFVVVFDDGTQATLVAEDLLDGCAEPFEENVFYANVLKDWHQEHAKAVRPAASTQYLSSFARAKKWRLLLEQ